jgi:transposase-like protein
MEKRPNGKYTKEFREEAVKLVTAKGRSIDDAAKRLSLPKSTLANWIKSFKAGKLGDIVKGYRTLSDTELEIARLRRELAEVKMEREVRIKRQRRIYALWVLCEGFPARYAMINKLRRQYPFSVLCRQFNVTLSGYYRWQITPLCARKLGLKCK